MKKLLRKLFGRPTENAQETNKFIFIEQLPNGELNVQININTTDQDVLDITTEYYTQVIAPIYLGIHQKKIEDRKAKQLVNGLINNVEGVTFSKHD